MSLFFLTVIFQVLLLKTQNSQNLLFSHYINIIGSMKGEIECL